jgi:hypothetical protein
VRHRSQPEDAFARRNPALLVFPKYIAAGKKVTPAEEFPRWEEGVQAMYDQMARIDITPTWATVHDFETRIPKEVEDLARSKFGEH